MSFLLKAVNIPLYMYTRFCSSIQSNFFSKKLIFMENFTYVHKSRKNSIVNPLNWLLIFTNYQCFRQRLTMSHHYFIVSSGPSSVAHVTVTVGVLAGHCGYPATSGPLREFPHEKLWNLEVLYIGLRSYSAFSLLIRIAFLMWVPFLPGMPGSFHLSEDAQA